MKFPALEKKQEELSAKRKELADIFDGAFNEQGELDTSKIDGLDGDSHDKVEQIRALNEEFNDLKDEVDELRTVGDAAEKVTSNGDDPSGMEPGFGGRSQNGKPKSLGDHFVESDAFKEFRPGGDSPIATLPIGLEAIRRPKATLFETGAGWAPESTRSGRIVLDAQRPVEVTDLIPEIEWGQAAYPYMEETTFTSGAAETAEGGTYGEATLVLTEKTANVRKVTVWLPVTDEQLEDVPGARDYVEARLRFMLRQRLDGQILTGDGVAPNLTGVNNVSGIQTQAKGTDPVPDAVYKAITKVETTGRAMPEVVIFHPNDWQDVRLLRTSDGIYIWGSPSESGPDRIWGLPVVKSSAQTENTAVVGDFSNFSLLPVRRGIDVQVSNSHSSHFVEGKQAIRADLRTALVFLRPAAFATVTGI